MYIIIKNHDTRTHVIVLMSLNIYLFDTYIYHTI